MSSSADLYEAEDQVKDIEDKEDKSSSSSTASIVAAVIITAIVVAVICVPTTYYLHPDYIDPDDPPLPILDCPSEEPKISTQRPTPTPHSTEPPNPENNRFDCGPDRDGIDQTVCESRGCTWSQATTSGPPSCFYPEDYGTYDTNEFFTESWGYRAVLRRRASTPNHFTEGIDTLWLDVELQTKSRLHFKVIVVCAVTAAVVIVICVPTTYFLHPDKKNADATCRPPDGLYPSDQPTEGLSTTVQSPSPENWKFDCFPDRDSELSVELCESRGCVYAESENEGVPRCYFPDGYGSYRQTGDAQDLSWGQRVNIERIPDRPTLFGSDIATLRVDVEVQTKHRVHIKIYDPNDQRFEVPNNLAGQPATKAEDTLYHVSFTSNPFSLQVTRTDTGTVVFDTSVGALVFEDQFLQLSTRLPSHNVYGFGEHEHESFRHDLNWKRWGTFARDQPPSPEANLYGTHPFYLCLENDFNAHGVFLNNANGQDVSLQPTPALTYRHIGGVFDFYMFFGPTPEDVVSQYTELIGRPYMPPYWALGFHLSRYGYNGIENVTRVVDRMRKYNIPHDVLYGDIDYMDRQRDFTIDEEIYGEENLANFVQRIKEEGTNYIIILDPAIAANETAGTYRPYDKGVEDDIFIHDANGGLLFGKNYRSYAVFPDFQRQQTRDWWELEIVDFHKRIDFDGIWIDMNEPANFVHGSVTGCTNNKWDYPPYHPKIWGATMADKTVCMNAIQNWDETTETTHYNMHNLYGWSQSEPTLQATRAATRKRSMVITRSTYAGSGKHNGHWLGDNASVWPHVHKSIIGMLEFNLFGVPFIGADICGFFVDTTEKLCRRWSQLGNFYSFARNHNGLDYRDQDPAAFGEAFAVEMRNLFAIRYTLLPYLYTLHYKATAHGHTVIRSLMHEFASDSNTWGIDRQFLWGPGFMITPVLEEDETSVDAYIPKSRWYDWYTGKEVDQSLAGSFVTLDAPESYIPLHIRGGHILPTQQPANSTKFSRNNPFGLIIALSEGYSAIGTLFWDDGESVDTIPNREYYEIEYIVAENNLVASIMNSYGTLLDNHRLDTISIHGMASRPPWVKLNGQQLMDPQWTYNDNDKILGIVDLQQPMTQPFKLSWN
ncbi:Sucrase-isomaltase, intestinal [Holothuria leucospilota]|uniref:Maltase n=1 Tax=Holothuria leucospilota TaxID=206669 RepID=A0A9Q1BMF7_HOLLE|nr:Sucrase-isomaltase, intestinal [Holothuria leucospilota]